MPQVARGEAMARERTSSERYFRVYERNPCKRAWRNVWVFVYLAKIFLLWLIVGGRLRRQLRRARREGKVIELEKVMESI